MSVDGERSAQDAPSWYSAEQADAWAAGYNAARSELGERLAQVEAALARVRAALDDAPPRDRTELEGAIASDLAAGMSLRACARKQGVGVGVVRGVAKQGRHDQ